MQAVFLFIVAVLNFIFVYHIGHTDQRQGN
jgi:hypothetical protein